MSNIKDLKKRSEVRRKKLKLVYCGNDRKAQEEAETLFWLNAPIEAKFKAMEEFVRDELKRQGLTQYGPKLLRLTAIIRRSQG